jgi:hypothetical protein
MKKQILLLASMILSASILFAQKEIPTHPKEQINGNDYSQHHKFEDKRINFLSEKRSADFIEQQLRHVRDLQGLIWVIDSTYYYDGEGMDWQLESRYKNLSRNEYGNVTAAITHFYNEATQQWSNKYNYTISYHDGQVYDEYIRQAWNSATESWVDTYYDKTDENWNWLEFYYKQWDFENNVVTYGYRYLLTYNDKGENTKELRQELNLESNYWENYSQDLFTYNIDGKLESDIRQDWNQDANDWINYSKRLWTYNTDGATDYYIDMFWDLANNEWVNETKILFSYDEYENNIQKLEQGWDTETNVWGDINWKWTYTYDLSNNMLESLKQSHDNQNNVYDNVTKLTYTYDTFENQTLFLNQSWDSQTNQWINKYKGTYEYDTFGNLTLSLLQFWSIENNAWNNDYQRLYSYNEHGLQILYIRQTWNNEIGQWVNSYKDERYWSQIEVSNVAEIDQCLITVYPIPSLGYIKINSSINEPIEISIFDIHGRNLISKEISANNNQIDLSQLQKGIYFIRVNSNETHKIILK